MLVLFTGSRDLKPKAGRMTSLANETVREAA